MAHLSPINLLRAYAPCGLGYALVARLRRRVLWMPVWTWLIAAMLALVLPSYLDTTFSGGVSPVASAQIAPDGKGIRFLTREESDAPGVDWLGGYTVWQVESFGPEGWPGPFRWWPMWKDTQYQLQVHSNQAGASLLAQMDPEELAGAYVRFARDHANAPFDLSLVGPTCGAPPKRIFSDRLGPSSRSLVLADTPRQWRYQAVAANVLRLLQWPLWGAVGVMMLLRSRRELVAWRVWNGLCPRCGYEVAGRLPGPCPECGLGVDESLGKSCPPRPTSRGRVGEAGDR